MKDDVTKEEKEDRLKRLNEVVNKYSKESNEKLLDKNVPVLVVGPSMKGDNKVYGYTDTMKLVNIEGDENLIGQIVDVKITDAKSFSLDGIAINK